MSNRTDLLLGLEESGTEYSPRWKITSPDDAYWDADAGKWVLEGGTLYHDINEASTMIQELLVAHYGNMPARQFKVPVQIILYSDKEIPKDEIQAWLLRVARLSIDSKNHGNGPREGALAQFRIEWGDLQEDQ
jgi:hypothetical protein